MNTSLSSNDAQTASIHDALERATLLHASGRQREALRYLRIALDALHAGAGADERLFDRALGLRVRVLSAMDPERANADAANDT